MRLLIELAGNYLQAIFVWIVMSTGVQYIAFQYMFFQGVAVATAKTDMLTFRIEPGLKATVRTAAVRNVAARQRDCSDDSGLFQVQRRPDSGTAACV